MLSKKPQRMGLFAYLTFILKSDIIPPEHQPLERGEPHMFARVKKWLKPLSTGLILPTVFSLTGLLPEPVSTIFRLFEVIALVFTVLLFMNPEKDEDVKLGVTIFRGTMIWAAVAIVLKNFWFYPVSMSKSVVLFSALIYGGIVTVYVYNKLKLFREHRRKELDRKEHSAREAERQKLVEDINRLIGNEAETKALLTALDRLTKYVPEVAERILTAVRNDAERFVMLRGLIATTQNEVLKHKCSSEADDIVMSARKLCSDSTEMALELLEEYQAAEADQALGEVRGPQLAVAHAEFKHYLEGLREALPKTDDTLASEIDSLSPPKQTLRLAARRNSRA
jgi:hypothetical protein